MELVAAEPCGRVRGHVSRQHSLAAIAIGWELTIDDVAPPDACEAVGRAAVRTRSSPDRWELERV